MTLPNILVFLVIGLAAGWVAGRTLGGGGFGTIGDMIIGVVGAFLGQWLFGLWGITAGESIPLAVVIAIVGACVLTVIIRTVQKYI
jgi:uncharacterized membrane protein YeaQ/YmgE (transglycosylase-associated protein family)